MNILLFYIISTSVFKKKKKNDLLQSFDCFWPTTSVFFCHRKLHFFFFKTHENDPSGFGYIRYPIELWLFVNNGLYLERRWSYNRRKMPNEFFIPIGFVRSEKQKPENLFIFWLIQTFQTPSFKEQTFQPISITCYEKVEIDFLHTTLSWNLFFAHFFINLRKLLPETVKKFHSRYIPTLPTDFNVFISTASI